MSVKFIELTFFSIKLTIIAKENKALVFDDNNPFNYYKLSTVHSMMKKSYKQFHYFYSFVPNALNTNTLVDQTMQELKRSYISEKILNHKPTIITDINVCINNADDLHVLNLYFTII